MNKTLLIVSHHVEWEGTETRYYAVDDESLPSILMIQKNIDNDYRLCVSDIEKLLIEDHKAIALSFEDGYSVDDYDTLSVQCYAVPTFDKVVTISFTTR